MSILHAISPHESIRKARAARQLKHQLVAVLMVLAIAVSYWRGIEVGKMLALKEAYRVYKAEVSWECS